MNDRRPLENMQILVVEDEYLIANDLTDAIAEAGGRPMGPCPDIESARQLLKQGDVPHGAVLDINLGGASVSALAHQLAGLGVHLLYHTGYDTKPRHEGLPPGKLLVKPTRRQDLQSALASAFGSVDA